MDAEAWLAAQERLISRGEWQPPAPTPSTPAAKPPTIAEYASTVIGRRRLRPATVALYEKLLRLAIVPAFGGRQPSEISVADVTAWYRSMNATPTQPANAYGLLKSILKDAVEDGLIATNPCRVKAGGQKSRAREIDVLSVEQLTAYLAAVPEGPPGAVAARRLVRAAFGRSAGTARPRSRPGRRRGAGAAGRRPTQGPTADRPTQDRRRRPRCHDPAAPIARPARVDAPPTDTCTRRSPVPGQRRRVTTQRRRAAVPEGL